MTYYDDNLDIQIENLTWNFTATPETITDWTEYKTLLTQRETLEADPSVVAYRAITRGTTQDQQAA